VLAVVAVGLFSVGLAVRLHCQLDGCHWARDRYLDLDAIDGLPRLFTTGLFVAVAVAGWVAARRVGGRRGRWWAAVALIGAALAVLKLLSAHSTLKDSAAAATLIGGIALSVVVLSGLWWTARRWGVAAGPYVAVALGIYASAALGLDAVTGLVASLHGGSGPVLDAASTFVEELGEALAALLVLTAVWWHLPAGPGGCDRRRTPQPGGGA
jgi:hypothetical protein